jgi:methylase of polypeptide subunit release factors
MPRISASLIRHAFSISPYLPLLLPATRDLALAQNELRWLRSHAIKTARLAQLNPKRHITPPRSLYQLCRLRATGRPLQYILGSQPFGELEILCRPGVLIPR